MISAQIRPAVPPKLENMVAIPSPCRTEIRIEAAAGHRTDSHVVTGIPRWSLIVFPQMNVIFSVI
ncbi:hypothetical protein B5K06_31350 [Rhizobium grahamii]|uniref:Uncharacterized protein n=1 Tax=Rhizobium grahamii TaxID=1120045 RepID=A0A370KF73_9HYPH|nr:hypothetical protein B5K06_31350 [Rhizobium grahamii]